MLGQWTVEDLLLELKRYPKKTPIKVGYDDALSPLNDVEFWNDGDVQFLALTFDSCRS